MHNRKPTIPAGMLRNVLLGCVLGLFLIGVGRAQDQRIPQADLNTASSTLAKVEGFETLLKRIATCNNQGARFELDVAMLYADRVARLGVIVQPRDGSGGPREIDLLLKDGTVVEPKSSYMFGRTFADFTQGSWTMDGNPYVPKEVSRLTKQMGWHARDFPGAPFEIVFKHQPADAVMRVIRKVAAEHGMNVKVLQYMENTSAARKQPYLRLVEQIVTQPAAAQNANATARRTALETLRVAGQAAPVGSPRWAIAGGFAAAVAAFPGRALQTARKSLANVSKSGAVSSMKGHALGAANFGTALFLKELMVAAETRNLDGITALGREMATPRFWASYGAFVVGARASQVGFEKLLAQMAPKILRGVLRSNIALAGGLLAMELLNGTFEPKRFAVTFGSLFVASAIVHAVKWALIGGLVLTGPVGWIILAVDLAVTLYLADKIEGLFTKWFQKAEKSSEDKNLRPELRSVAAPTTGGGGIAEQLEQINEFLDNFSTPPLNQPAE